MALICPDFGNEVNNDNNTDYVIVHGYEEIFAIDWYISLYQDGQCLGEVAPKFRYKIPIEHDCELKFKCWFRKRTIHIRKGIDTHIFLSFDRFTGSLKAYPASEDNIEDIERLKNKKASRATLYSIILFIILFCFFVIASCNYYNLI